MRILIILAVVLCVSACRSGNSKVAAIVIQTDFGVKDGAVSAMKGVAHAVDDQLPVFDLTHEIPPYNIWEAAYRLEQTVPYWPAGTVFVSVVDPGVGTDRQSVVAKTRNGYYIVTPDNGTLTLLADNDGIESLRQIDEAVNRRQGSSESYTFHGRDVYVYTAARLASGQIKYENVGPLLNRPVVKIPYQAAELRDNTIKGNIPILDIQYGNVWTNIPDSLIKKSGIKIGDNLNVTIFHRDSIVYSSKIPFVHTFGEVAEGKPLAYMNSLMNFSLALNMASFADTYKIGTGPAWSMEIKR